MEKEYKFGSDNKRMVNKWGEVAMMESENQTNENI